MKNKNPAKLNTPLSPRKFIETRARKLPIHECYVNNDWKETQMANVVVMRKHANDKITAGIYLVDLLCLGIKDTVFVFNEEEPAFKERVFELQSGDLQFDKIEYALAHNIVYAGHDYAMDYDIKPDAEFATTKYILEEDTDDIELIEIEVGDKKGNPVLIVKQSGQYADALMKLKKIAGEGNYTYLVDGESLGEEEFDESEYYDLDDYGDGAINPFMAANIKSSDLVDKDKVNRRSRADIFSMQSEVYMRLLLDQEAHFIYEEGVEFDWIQGALNYPAELIQADVKDFEAALDEFNVALEKDNVGGNRFSETLIKVLNKYPSNLLLASAVHLQECLIPDDEVHRISHLLLQPYVGKQPLAVLTLAVYDLLKNRGASEYDYIYQEENIRKLFPNVECFLPIELLLFFLVKVLIFTRSANLQQALKYYQLVSNINITSFVLMPVQVEFLAFLDKQIYDPEELEAAQEP